MKIITSPSEMYEWAVAQKNNGRTIALVPTMGCLHEGHLSLIDLALQNGDLVVVSIFVNPMQFGPNEDLDAYPRQFEIDCKLAKERGANLIFAPSDNEMYPPGFQSRITVTGLSKGLCGADRPGHFDGVATVVTKLFHLTSADFAIFGEKDFQQLSIIRQLVKDLSMAVKIIGAPIVREPDGLAMSSRNKYLKDDERKIALCLSRGIEAAKNLVRSGTFTSSIIISNVKQIITDAGAAVEYAEIVDMYSLKGQETVNNASVLTVAAKVGGRVRLIDNSVLL